MTIIWSFLSFCGFIFLHLVLVARAVGMAIMMLIGAVGASLGRRLL